MPRPEKVQAVADIKERLEDSAAVFLAEYAGLSVGEQQELRRGLRAAESEFKIVKMTLARLAAAELGHDELVADLSGPTGLAFASGDAAAAAKVLRDFAKDHAQLILKGGLLGSEPLTPERVQQLAELDSRDVLLAKLAGAFQAPLTGMAGLLAALPRNLASAIQQLIDKLPADTGADDTGAPEASTDAADGAEAAEASGEVGEPEASAEEPAAEDSESAESVSDDAGGGATEGPEVSGESDEPASPDDEVTEQDTAEQAEEE